MSDAAIRDLERAARSGDPQAEERLLVARLRAGTIEVWRLHLADAAGSGAAARALGRPPLVIQLGPLLSHVENLMRAEESRAQAKSAGVLAACAMVEVAQRHHHEHNARWRQLGAHQPGRRVREGQLRRALRFTDGGSELEVQYLETCSDVTCDLALRCADAARAWVASTTEPARHDDARLCFSLAQMTMPLIEPGHGDFRRQRLDRIDWPAVPCTMAAHEGGRPDLLARLHDRARRMPITERRTIGGLDVDAVERSELGAMVRMDLELRAAVCAELARWALA